jgi:hypothetical protein
MMIAPPDINSWKSVERRVVQLVINRNQAAVKGMLGGHKGMQFTLAYRLVLTAEEQELVERYKLADYPLTFKTMQGTTIPDDTIAKMTAGRSQTVTDVTTLVSNEETIKSACDGLPALLEVVRTFGGEEVISYPRDTAG